MKKPKQREVIEAQASIVLLHGALEDVSGEFEVISPRHLYNWRMGRDVYPTKEQLEQRRRASSDYSAVGA